MNTITSAVNQQDKPRRGNAKPVALTDEEIIRREMKAYEQKKEEYLKKYEGQYIATLNGELLDSDTDFSDLATRVYEKLGYRTIFMTLVTKHKKPYKIALTNLLGNASNFN